ncbi:hypothetical protein MRX96_029911 [Rhipicephalus microplus]
MGDSGGLARGRDTERILRACSLLYWCDSVLFILTLMTRMLQPRLFPPRQLLVHGRLLCNVTIAAVFVGDCVTQRWFELGFDMDALESVTRSGPPGRAAETRVTAALESAVVAAVVDLEAHQCSISDTAASRILCNPAVPSLPSVGTICELSFTWSSQCRVLRPRR